MLSPAYFIDSIEAIAALMRRDVGLASRLLVRLSDLIRQAHSGKSLPEDKGVEFERFEAELELPAPERRRNRRASAAADAAAMRLIVDELSPHFVFSSLHAVSALAGEDPEQAAHLLGLLARAVRLLRPALEQSGRDTTLAEEVELSHPLLELERVRYGHPESISWLVDDVALRGRIPRLILHELFVRTLQHAIVADARVLSTRISAQRRNALLTIQVLGSAAESPSGATTEISAAATGTGHRRLPSSSYRLGTRLLSTGAVLTELELPWAEGPQLSPSLQLTT